MPIATLESEGLDIRDTEIAKEDLTGETEGVVCLNCGHKVSGNYCSHCGQASNVPKKITNKTFGKSVAMSFTRLNPGFFNTLVKLCYKPWDVIRDYIHGKQVSYSHPVSMLIQLTLYTSFLYMMIEGILGIQLQEINDDTGDANGFIKAIKESTVLNVLWISVPVIVALYLAYWKYGSRRFTLSEYVIAWLYMVISLRIYAFFLIPLSAYFFDGDQNDLFKFLVALTGLLIISPIAVSKAFKVKPGWKAACVFMWFIILAIVFMLLYVKGCHYLFSMLGI